MAVALTLPIGGRKLVGFNYRAVVDTEFTACPERVVEQSGDVITLTTGERFKVHGLPPGGLNNALQQCGSFVKVDREHRYLSVRRHADICGHKADHAQWITIPLRATEKVQTYLAVELADLQPLSKASEK